MENPIRFVTPVYNAREFIGDCINSTKSQDNSNFTHYILDDASTDGTWDIIKEMTEGDSRYVAVRNETKMCTLYNHIKLMLEFEWDLQDVVAHLDGDDMLAHDGVVSYLHDVYDRTGCWVTYGDWEPFPKDYTPVIDNVSDKSCNRPMQEGVNFRQDAWEWSHLRTFKRFLFDRIPYENFLDERGVLYTAAPDIALFLPVLEMAGRERIHFCDDILHLYRQHPDNEHQSMAKLTDQVRCAIHYKAKPPFDTL
jgi:glycosyltransferase involved in cell wall biosynthesis